MKHRLFPVAAVAVALLALSACQKKVREINKYQVLSDEQLKEVEYAYTALDIASETYQSRQVYSTNGGSPLSPPPPTNTEEKAAILTKSDKCEFIGSEGVVTSPFDLDTVRIVDGEECPYDIRIEAGGKISSDDGSKPTKMTLYYSLSVKVTEPGSLKPFDHAHRFEALNSLIFYSWATSSEKNKWKAQILDDVSSVSVKAKGQRRGKGLIKNIEELKTPKNELPKRHDEIESEAQLVTLSMGTILVKLESWIIENETTLEHHRSVTYEMPGPYQAVFKAVDTTDVKGKVIDRKSSVNEIPVNTLNGRGNIPLPRVLSKEFLMLAYDSPVTEKDVVVEVIEVDP